MPVIAGGTNFLPPPAGTQNKYISVSYEFAQSGIINDTDVCPSLASVFCSAPEEGSTVSYLVMEKLQKKSQCVCEAFLFLSLKALQNFPEEIDVI